MNKNNYCLLDGMEEHICRRCDACYCKFIDEHGQEPTDEEIEAEIERQIAEAEARSDSLQEVKLDDD